MFLESGAESAIKKLDGTTFNGKRIKVELARGDGHVKRREDERKGSINPSRTLFVVNFDPVETRERDLRSLFEQFGTVIRVDLRRNYAFVEYDTLEQATQALEKLRGFKILEREITVEYVAGGGRRNRSSSPKRRFDKSYSPRRYGAGYSPPRADRYPQRSYSHDTDRKHDDRSSRNYDRAYGRDRERDREREKERERDRDILPEGRDHSRDRDRNRDDYRSSTRSSSTREERNRRQ